MRTLHVAIAISVLGLGACKTGGEYAQGAREPGDVDRGETNGRMFDFVSYKPEGDDWQIRIRGSSIWASYSHEDSSDELPSKNLSDKEAGKVWKLIDALEMEERKKGKKDEDEGYVSLRLREPGGEEGHDIIEIYISRATEDDDVIALAEYLQDLIFKYHKEKPNF